MSSEEEETAGSVAHCRPRGCTAEMAGKERTHRSAQPSIATPVAAAAGQAASTERSGRDDGGVSGWHKPS
ncbi:unnamed protein product, partial [Ectocarpus sp. 13 AM-2016]